VKREAIPAPVAVSALLQELNPPGQALSAPG
jgi:hypothetical protein